MTSSDLAAQIAQLSLDKKADHVLSIEVKDLTSITDHFVICSADTDVQVKAISDSIRRNTDHKPIRIEGYQQLNWVLLDYIDVIVHIFRTTERNYYNIEKLWADAPIIEYNDDDFITANPSAD
ncbi:MAG: ribosome silencing factor [Candidatus Marinimicrobia bacterium]|nr:ribosome silencing factor [Candidatus Neomarinimicrobiota bacterium]MBT3675495.1 ribosome silencing factor [Candidatus Neomarinimicrobiota bacterium]MBT3762793.1 ribosome silencing factor [Candidatus Neomarinimicrobiota bacterium]MBT4069273.1 ribosome silencing factor [Candidatus Neomarinimicrobiota bacterium]MBT4270414.1 ribosome silencing factor [Candidatus Neomarinimicrobiota bacterium]